MGNKNKGALMNPPGRSIGEMKAELKALRDKKAQAQKPPVEKNWYGLVFLEPSGFCSITDFQGGQQRRINLGRSVEIIPYLRDQGIDGNDFDGVMAACRNYHQGHGQPPGKDPRQPINRLVAPNKPQKRHRRPTAPHNTPGAQHAIVHATRNRLNSPEKRTRRAGKAAYS